MLVVDASALVELLLDLPLGLAVGARLEQEPRRLHAPHLLDVEVAQVVRRYEQRGEIDAATGLAALEELADLRLRRHAHPALLARAFELRANATMYDAIYLALAEGLDAPLVTTDRRLAQVPGCRASVDVLEVPG